MSSNPESEIEIGSGWEARIRELEARGIRAFLAGDLETLRRLWSEDLAVNSPLNRIHSGGQVLELLGHGVIRHASQEAAARSLALPRMAAKRGSGRSGARNGQCSVMKGYG